MRDTAWLRLRGSVTGAVLVIAVAAAAGPALATAGRRPVPRFDYRTFLPPGDRLAGVSCVTGAFCLAVGSYTDPLGAAHSLAEAWNGSAWRVVPGATGTGLSGVSCTSATFCMAVGSPTQEWTGKRWKPLRTPPHANLLGVSCTRATFCMAVGAGTVCEAGAVWNGATWRGLPMPSPCGPEFGFLARVSCASASNCLAVGTFMPDSADQETLAEGWNGTRWRFLNAPSPGDHAVDHLSGVSCLSRSSCMAVGGIINENMPTCMNLCDLALTWNGSTWTQLTTPATGGGMSGVSCRSADRCVAIRASSAVAWDGSAWANLTTAQPGATSLADISCWHQAACMAVGSYATMDGATLSLAEQWNGSTWQARRTPNPGNAFTGLSAVSCASAERCVAVGDFIDSSDTQATLAERWNGRRWLVLSTPGPGPHANALLAVSCPGSSSCMAVGYHDAAGGLQALAERWNGTSWQVLAVPHRGRLTGVSCPVSTSSCMAVGSFLTSSGVRKTLSATWNGAAWAVQASPDFKGTITEFNAVSCTSARDCMAVGDYNTFVVNPLLPLTARWNGAAWQVLKTPIPGGSGGLYSVSCTGPSSCMATGSHFNVTGHAFATRALAESWNGGSWQPRATPRIFGRLHALLAAVSCSVPTRTGPAHCVAAGGLTTLSGRFLALAESWNGTSWSLLPIRSPNPVFNDLYGISCPAATRCIAVGEAGVQRTSAYRWNGTAWLLLRPPSP